ncbi:MAG: hypothetical protein ACJAZJ_001606, partial [Candidatus Endobugula sp.]
ANFPTEQSKALGINVVTMLDNIEEIKELDSGIDDLLD